MWKVIGTNISQKFNQRLIFKNISFEITNGQSIVLAGPNGSGKTTLIRIICQLMRPSNGEVKFTNNGQSVHRDNIYPHIGIVGPYLQLYKQLTALENYTFFTKIRGISVDTIQFKQLMKHLGLEGRELDELRTYSSGMLQRMKYVLALIHQPQILILDEPTSNLDEAGARVVHTIMENQKKEKILILATNEPGELRFGDTQIKLVS